MTQPNMRNLFHNLCHYLQCHLQSQENNGTKIVPVRGNLLRFWEAIKEKLPTELSHEKVPSKWRSRLLQSKGFIFFTANMTHFNDGIGCSKCLSYDYEDLCNHSKSDHNFFAICKVNFFGTKSAMNTLIF